MESYVHKMDQNASQSLSKYDSSWFQWAIKGIERSKLANTIPWVELSWWGPNGPKVKYSPASEAK